MIPTSHLGEGPAPRLAWLPPFVVAAAAAVSAEVAVSVLLYGGAGFVRSLTTILGTAGLSFSLGLWSAPSPGGDFVEKLRRRWVFCLMAFLAAAIFGTLWSVLEAVGSTRWGQGAGLALLAGLPLYASGSVLGGISTAAQTDAGGRLPHPRAAAAFGATAGVVATGLLLPTAPMPGSLLIGCLVALSLGGMVFGAVLAARTDVAEVTRRPGRPADVVVADVRRSVDELDRREMFEGAHLRRSLPLSGGGRTPWDVAVARAILPALDAPVRFLFVGSGPSAAPRAIVREHPLARVTVLERTAASIELGREYFSTDLAVGVEERLTVEVGNLEDLLSALEGQVDVVVVDTGGLAILGGVSGLSQESRRRLTELLSPSGLLAWGPGPREAGTPEAPEGWSHATYRRPVDLFGDEHVLITRRPGGDSWPDRFDDFVRG